MKTVTAAGDRDQNVGWLRRIDGRAAAWACLLCSLGLTALAWSLAARAVEERSAERFTAEVDRLTRVLTRRLTEHVSVLRGGAALFAASREVDRDEWQQFASTLLQDALPDGLEALGYVPVLPHENRATFIHAAQASGMASFRISPGGDRGDYGPVLFVEPPTAKNARLLGFDLRVEGGLREAMDRARDAGEAVAADGRRVDLGGQRGGGAELFIFFPLYKRGESVATIEHRRAAHVGFVFGLVRWEALADATLHEAEGKLEFEVYDGPEPRARGHLYQSPLFADPPHGKRLGAREAWRKLEALERSWAMHLRSRVALDAELAGREHLYVGLIGLIIDGLLFAFVWTLVRQQREARLNAQLMAKVVQELREREGELNLAQRVARVGSWTYAVAPKELRWSRETYELLGVAPGAAVSHERFLELVAPEDRARAAGAWESALAGAPYQLEHRVTVGGKVRWLHQRAEVRFDAGGVAAALVGTTQDVTERHEAEQGLRLAANVFKHAREAIVITDSQARILDVNDTFVEMSGYARDELLGKNPRILRSGRQDRAFYAEMWERIEERGFWRGEVWNRRRNGELYATSLNISALIEPKSGKVSHYIGISSDITELKRSQQELERLAYHDPLTRLPNRTLLKDRLAMAVAQVRRSDRFFVVVYLDLDGFKPVNDRLGHEAGDEVLVEVARRLERSFRATDTVARVGGDEFAILISEPRGREDAERSAVRVLELLARPVAVRGEEFALSASIGMAACPQDGTDPDALLRCADAAMYLAKRSGGGSWQWYVREPKGAPAKGDAKGSPPEGAPSAPSARASPGQGQSPA